MWPFRRNPSNAELEERFERLKRDFIALQEEWDDAFDRMRRAENRIKEKRAKMAEQETRAEGTDAAPLLEGSNGSVPFRLNERQRNIQQAVLRRRAGVA